ncbi:ABC transporter ATP-binding protein/permease [Laspinema olomoucense]|uniref:ABC transporter ATP-binding protein/permease n=1 Tax=Laspinema olomoucense D3b TaxID=2953688 RepID=A0ABT2NFM3_9CYAN|nr:ABC transporter ATP-binding protein/permease [Laspinema sp. D3b]MCT7981503.1 ABC transporter ATP-binding protein/permease [Laspinema sp. D3b]
MKKLKIDFSACQRFWAVAKPYWWDSQERWQAIGLLVLVMFLLTLQTQMNVLQNGQRGEFTSALAEKNAGRFWQSVLTYLVACIIFVTLQSVNSYLEEKSRWFWRSWLTNYYLQKYMTNRNFYRLGSWTAKIDNPDQRISQDIERFCQMSLVLFMNFSSSLVNIIAFGVVLWSMSHNLVILLIVYAGLGMLITTVGFGRILIPLQTEQLKQEANFRFGLVRIRENAESIAFYRGDSRELNNVKQIFNVVLSNYNKIILWETKLAFFSSGYQVITWILPAVILGPRILSGETEVGILVEAGGAFINVFSSLIVVVRMFKNITRFVAAIERLESLEKVLEEPKASPIDNNTTIDTIEDSSLSLEHITLQTPNYNRTLVKDVSVEMQSGERLLIVGVSGCGKSSIVRAIAGLWNSGTGTIHRPKLGEILFLPQRPYMILGSLRDQLLYPSTNLNISDLEIYEVLKQVNLPELAERFGGLDAIEDWDHVLSIGEQQRVAFARLLLTHPRYAILDEATSALDVKNEQSLYNHLQKLSTIYLSVGHRPTLLQYHHKVLEVHDDETWRVISAKDYNFMSMN